MSRILIEYSLVVRDERPLRLECVRLNVSEVEVDDALVHLISVLKC
jgi:hypothetical protein